MTQQDYTAPEMPIRLSRKERFRHVFQCFRQSGPTGAVPPATADQPDDLTGYLFSCQVFDQAGHLMVSLSESDGLSRPASNAVQVEISTARMGTLGNGKFRAELYAHKDGEREDFVHLILTVE